MVTSGSALPPLEILQTEDFSQYLLREPREIEFVLRQLGARRAMITAYFGSGRDFLLTSVIDLSSDKTQLILDLGKDETIIEQALVQGGLLCATQLEKVKIQFPLEKIERTQHQGFPALRARLPEILLRLQRREYYRLSTPSLDSLNCQITLPDGHKSSVRVLDISGGGLAIVAPPAGEAMEVGSIFEHCSLTLPDTPPISLTLQVRNVFHMSTRGGQKILRAGCQLLGLRAADANLIQRYILKTERERNHYRV